MKTAKTVFTILGVSLCSFGLFSSQKTATANSNSTKTDSTKAKEVHVNGQKVDLPVIATLQNIESLLKQQKAVVFHYGFAPVYNPEFEKKYGVKIVNQGCVVMPAESKSLEVNNKVVSDFLTKNFGEAWKKDLGFQPFGTK